MSPRNQTLPEGKATNISCKVKSGVPKPALSWSFKDKRLPPVIAVTEMENGSVIHVQNTTKYMVGTYKCTARNKANESTATSTLRVLGMLWVFICNDLSRFWVCNYCIWFFFVSIQKSIESNQIC